MVASSLELRETMEGKGNAVIRVGNERPLKEVHHKVGSEPDIQTPITVINRTLGWDRSEHRRLHSTEGKEMFSS